MPEGEAITGFDPGTHGFRFRNRFPITLRDLGLPFDGQLGQGLCGGMCLEAKRRYVRSEPVPTDPDPPDRGSTLYRTIWQAQIDSLLPTTWARFIRWQARGSGADPDRRRSITTLTKREWPKLRGRLDAGEPTLLGLVRVASKNPARAGHNHQILATGYEILADRGSVRIDVYDPNHPGLAVALLMSLGHSPEETVLRQSTGETLRGFFVSAAR